MDLSGQGATWVELAVAPEWRKQRSKICLHAVGGLRDGCYALSMDGRWLRASDGKLTVFRGREAAMHFLHAIRIDHVDTGEASAERVCCDGRHLGLRLDPQGRLAACRSCGCREG